MFRRVRVVNIPYFEEQLGGIGKRNKIKSKYFDYAGLKKIDHYESYKRIFKNLIIFNSTESAGNIPGSDAIQIFEIDYNPKQLESL